MRRTATAVISFGCAMGVLTAAGISPASASAAGRGESSGSVSGAGAPARAAEGVPADHTKGALTRGSHDDGRQQAENDRVRRLLDQRAVQLASLPSRHRSKSVRSLRHQCRLSRQPWRQPELSFESYWPSADNHHYRRRRVGHTADALPAGRGRPRRARGRSPGQQCPPSRLVRAVHDQHTGSVRPAARVPGLGGPLEYVRNWHLRGRRDPGREHHPRHAETGGPVARRRSTGRRDESSQASGGPAGETEAIADARSRTLPIKVGGVGGAARPAVTPTSTAAPTPTPTLTPPPDHAHAVHVTPTSPVRRRPAPWPRTASRTSRPRRSTASTPAPRRRSTQCGRGKRSIPASASTSAA